MKIKNKPAYVYDIEVFKNVFHCTVFDTETEELHKFDPTEDPLFTLENETYV